MATLYLRYAFSERARAQVAIVTGSLDPNASPKSTTEAVGLIPLKGDVLEWESHPGLRLFVATRQIKYRADGATEMVLILDAFEPE